MAGILIQHSQHLKRAALVRPVKDEIPGPNVVAMGGLRGQTRRYPLPSDALGPGTDFQTLFPSDTLDLFAADRPALPLQYRADSSIAVARIVPG